MIDIPKNKSEYAFIPEVGWLPRVTNVLKIISKGEAFDNWLRSKGQESKTLLSEAGDIGSSLHQRLEEIGKGIPINREALKDQEKAWVEKFDQWSKENIEKFIETERPVWSLKDGYAGTLDSIVLLKGGQVTALLDYKTSKYIYDTYDLQVSAYVKAYEEMFKVKINTAYILRFDKTDGKLEVKEVKGIHVHYEVFLCALRLWNWKNSKEVKFYPRKAKG